MKKMLHTKALIERANIKQDEPGIIRNVIGSTSVVDRMGDIIEQEGWNLKDYLNNRIILWGHNVREEKLPIGKALKVWVENKGSKKAKLMFDIKFDLRDPFAAEVYRKIDEGYLNTVSVGFLPHEWEELDPDNWFGGLKFTSQDLLELSVVPVPANQEALIQLNSFAKEDKRFTPVKEKEVFEHQEDNRDKRMLKDSKLVNFDQVEKGKENEFVTELISIKEFEEDSFRVLPMKKGEKDYTIIVGKLKGSDEYVEQSHRYSKDVWKEEDVINSKPENKDKDEKVNNENKETKDYDDATKLNKVTVADLRSIIDDVWANGYKPEDDEDDKANKALPDDDLSMNDLSVGDYKSLLDDCFSDWRTLDEDKGFKKNLQILLKKESEITKEEIKSVLEVVTKSGRVLSQKNESKVRQAMDLLVQVLAELDKDEADDAGKGEVDDEKSNSKKVLPYKDLGTLPESEKWDSQDEVNKATVEDLKLMSAWYDDEKADDKASYKLVHHKFDDGHKAVWRGVAACMAALLGAQSNDIPEEDRKGVYNHLKKHYEEFEKDVPEFTKVEDQVLAGFVEEIHALILDREDKHAVRLLYRILNNQREQRKGDKEIKTTEGVTNEQAIEALKIIHLALTKVNIQKGGVEK